MDSERVGRWLTLAANFGLLAGLILVAYEIEQNSDLVRMQLVNDGNATLNEVYSVLMGDDAAAAIARSVERPDEISYADFMVVDSFLFTAMNMYYRNYELAKEGIYDDADWQQPLGPVVGWFLANPFGRAWWDEEARHFFAQEFVAYVDERLADDALRDSESYWRGVRNRLKSN